MRHVRRKICPDSMFQKWQLWTKLHKFEKTAQLAGLGLCSTLGRASSIKHNMRQFGDKTGNCNSQHKVWREMDRRVERTKEAEGWLAWLRNTLCVSIYPLSRVTPRDMWRAPAVAMPNVPITSITHNSRALGWEEGGIFRLLKVHLLHFQQVLVSNEGNDECFCWDELACVCGAGGGNTQKSGCVQCSSSGT